MTDMTNDAKALLLSCFLHPRATLRYKMVEQQPSEQAAKGLSELVALGLVSETRETNGALVYSLTEAGGNVDRKKLCGEDDPFKWMETHAAFPLAITKETTK